MFELNELFFQVIRKNYGLKRKEIMFFDISTGRCHPISKKGHLDMKRGISPILLSDTTVFQRIWLSDNIIAFKHKKKILEQDPDSPFYYGDIILPHLMMNKNATPKFKNNNFYPRIKIFEENPYLCERILN